MNKEDISVAAQILSSMKDAINELEKAQKRKDLESINYEKNQILNLKEQLDKIL